MPEGRVATASIGADVDRVLAAFLAEERAALAAHRGAEAMVDEVARLVGAGGRRLRPTLCVLGHLAGGGQVGDPILRVAAAMELFHTFALIHDDVMDGSTERRGVASTPALLGGPGAVLVGDFTQVLADHLLLTSGFPPDVLVPALRRYTRMRVETGVGQWLDVTGEDATDEVYALKTGSYTVEGPLQVGAILAGAGPEVLAALSAYGRPLGIAFQQVDDLRDEPDTFIWDAGTAPSDELVAEAVRSLAGSPVPEDVQTALREVAEAIGAGA
jgi:geranylgeranyl diphosphate synthase type I